MEVCAAILKCFHAKLPVIIIVMPSENKLSISFAQIEEEKGSSKEKHNSYPFRTEEACRTMKQKFNIHISNQT